MFVPQAFIEPALLHAMLGISSSTIRMKHGKPFNPQVAFTELQYHKMASIKLINQKLQNVSDATKLSTILTIVTLFGSEVRTPIRVHLRRFAHNRNYQLAVEEDSDAIQIHLKGLKDLINLRGGFDGLPVFLIQVTLSYVALSASTSVLG